MIRWFSPLCLAHMIFTFGAVSRNVPNHLLIIKFRELLLVYKESAPNRSEKPVGNEPIGTYFENYQPIRRVPPPPPSPAIYSYGVPCTTIVIRISRAYRIILRILRLSRFSYRVMCFFTRGYPSKPGRTDKLIGRCPG